MVSTEGTDAPASGGVSPQVTERIIRCYQGLTPPLAKTPPGSIRTVDQFLPMHAKAAAAAFWISSGIMSLI